MRSFSQWQLAPFHPGAAIGPMTSGALAVIFSILMGAFGVDRAALSLAVPVYMIPYAGVQLVSGGISDLTSRRSSLLLGFGSYGAATLLTGLAPTFPLFLLGQALLGTTNAFTTPILMATLGDIVPSERMGRTMGLFSSTNLAGAMIGPLLAGVLAGIHWRLIYVAVAAMSWALMLWYVVWFRRYGAAVPPRPRGAHLRADLSRMLRALGLPIVLLASLSFCANGATRGASYLFGDYLRDAWGTGVGTAGVILAMYGLAGLLAGPFAGAVIERAGVYRGIAGGMVGVAGALVVMMAATSPWSFAAGNFLLGVTGIVAWAALNTLAVEAVPEHRGTASSIFGSAKFLVQAIAPLWFTPLYQSVAPRSIFAVSALLAIALLAPLAWLHARRARKPAGTPVTP